MNQALIQEKKEEKEVENWVYRKRGRKKGNEKGLFKRERSVLEFMNVIGIPQTPKRKNTEATGSSKETPRKKMKLQEDTDKDKKVTLVREKETEEYLFF